LSVLRKIETIMIGVELTNLGSYIMRDVRSIIAYLCLCLKYVSALNILGLHLIVDSVNFTSEFRIIVTSSHYKMWAYDSGTGFTLNSMKTGQRVRKY
jgi:hypothetical protein